MLFTYFLVVNLASINVLNDTLIPLIPKVELVVSISVSYKTITKILAGW